MPLKLMYITNNLNVALIAQKYGVDRIWIDLETMGKEERQKGINSVKSHHTIEDIRIIKPYLTTSEMLVRVNHWNNKSVQEVNDVIDAGADMIMLPYWKRPDEVRNFIETVNGRCKTTLLLETKEAVGCVDEVLAIPGIDEIHIGLNDLHLSYNLNFMFELLTNGIVEMLCRKIAESGLPYGFGGIAKIGYGDIPAEKIILEHYRLGSSRAILSRSFCDAEKINDAEKIKSIFAENMDRLRKFEYFAETVTEDVYERNREELGVAVKLITQMKKQRELIC